MCNQRISLNYNPLNSTNKKNMNTIFIPIEDIEDELEDKFNSEERLEKTKHKFIISNSLDPKIWNDIILDVPITDILNYFYLKLYSIGDKHFVSFEKTEQLVKWMKLTEELFLKSKL